MINKSHLMLREWKPEDALKEVCFDVTTFWVQIKALPLQFTMTKNAEMIGNFVLQIIKVRIFHRNKYYWTEIFKAAVEVDVRKPLPMGFFHNMGKGGRLISFQYERLPDICLSVRDLRSRENKLYGEKKGKPEDLR